MAESRQIGHLIENSVIPASPLSATRRFPYGATDRARWVLTSLYSERLADISHTRRFLCGRN